jgi:hypothetical protein
VRGRGEQLTVGATVRIVVSGDEFSGR